MAGLLEGYPHQSCADGDLVRIRMGLRACARVGARGRARVLGLGLGLCVPGT